RPLAKALMATPVSTRVTTSVRPLDRASRYTSAVVANPATNAAAATDQAATNAPPITMTVPAPTAAPADTPMTPGSASGLANTPCNNAPAVARAAPTRMASITRGNRTSHSVTSPAGWAGTGPQSRPTRCSTDPATSPMLVGTCPIAADA